MAKAKGCNEVKNTIVNVKHVGLDEKLLTSARDSSITPR